MYRSDTSVILVRCFSGGNKKSGSVWLRGSNVYDACYLNCSGRWGSGISIHLLCFEPIPSSPVIVFTAFVIRLLAPNS